MLRLTNAVFGLTAPFMLAGCADLAWEKPGASEAQTQAAVEACSRHAADQAWRDKWVNNWPPAFYDSSYMPPYYGVGSMPFWQGGPDTFEQEEDLNRFCMHSKGYRLKAVRS